VLSKPVPILEDIRDWGDAFSEDGIFVYVSGEGTQATRLLFCRWSREKRRLWFKGVKHLTTLPQGTWFI